MDVDINERDREQIAALGISVDEVCRQLELFRAPPSCADLVRACTRGDGIRVIAEDRARELETIHERAAAGGRFLKFVPASGAASRMFKSLSHFAGAAEEPERGMLEAAAEAGDGDARALLEFLDGLERFPFLDQLDGVLRAGTSGVREALAAGAVRSVLRALLHDEGLGHASLPKGLLPFHSYPEGVRTPFEEHLVEAAHTARAAGGLCRLHLTVSPEHRSGFERLLAERGARIEKELGVRFEVEFSVQKSRTDTVAADADNRPFRQRDDSLFFRPGGHGALIENLDELGADLVYIKNIDNVVPDHLKGETLRWKKCLGGLLVELQTSIFDHLEKLEDDGTWQTHLESASAFAREWLGFEPGEACGEELRARLIGLFERPLRVCGMVLNEGEPGGGPFWVRDPQGTVSAQIVEGAQVDTGDPGQREILASATHFNPVDLVCALRDRRGRPYELGAFIDPAAVFLSEKSKDGKVLKALERPGLWNGAMARWNTVFVEVPLATFAPVKTVNDLLRPTHQPE